MCLVILDEVPVKEDVINLSLHRFVGRFRPPYIHPPGYRAICACGDELISPSSSFDHWGLGHYDTLEYVTIHRETGIERYFREQQQIKGVI